MTSTAGHPEAEPSATLVERNTAQQQGASRILTGLALKSVSIIVGGAAVVAAVATYLWYDARFEQTDNAQVDGDISSVSARVSGTISGVHVVENQRVRAGDVLATLDKRDFEIALASAKASVAAARAEMAVEDPSVKLTQISLRAEQASTAAEVLATTASLSGSVRHVARLAAELAHFEARHRQAEMELDRAKQLMASSAIPPAEFDALANAKAAAAASVEGLRQQLAEAEERVRESEARLDKAKVRRAEVDAKAPEELETRKAAVMVRQARLDAALAAVDLAELNVAYTAIVAPVDGIVARKAVALGDRVAPGQQLIAIAQVDNLWVTANFRETQLARLKPGQAAEVYVDSLGVSLTGTIESIGGATGARLSIFPPENAAGNYVKVVQRLPVRIRLESGQQGLEHLRPGMSVEPKIHL